MEYRQRQDPRQIPRMDIRGHDQYRQRDRPIRFPRRTGPDRRPNRTQHDQPHRHPLCRVQAPRQRQNSAKNSIVIAPSAYKTSQKQRVFSHIRPPWPPAHCEYHRRQPRPPPSAQSHKSRPQQQRPVLRRPGQPQQNKCPRPPPPLSKPHRPYRQPHHHRVMMPHSPEFHDSQRTPPPCQPPPFIRNPVKKQPTERQLRHTRSQLHHPQRPAPQHRQPPLQRLQ